MPRQSAVERLNTDVMLSLFEAVFSTFVRHALPVSSQDHERIETTTAMMCVSKSWYHVIKNHPPLWNRLTFWTSGNDALDTKTWGNAQLIKMKENLARSASCPLDVHLGVLSTRFEKWEENLQFGWHVIALLRPHMHRIQNLSLHFKGFHPIWNIFPLNLGPDSILRHLSVTLDPIFVDDPPNINYNPPLVRPGRQPQDEPWLQPSPDGFRQSLFHRAIHSTHLVPLIAHNFKGCLTSVTIDTPYPHLLLPSAVLGPETRYYNARGSFGLNLPAQLHAMPQLHSLDLARAKFIAHGSQIPNSVVNLRLGRWLEFLQIYTSANLLHLGIHYAPGLLPQLKRNFPNLRTLTITDHTPKGDELLQFLHVSPSLVAVEVPFTYEERDVISPFLETLANGPIPSSLHILRMHLRKEYWDISERYTTLISSILDRHLHLKVEWKRPNTELERHYIMSYIRELYRTLRSRYPSRFIVVDSYELEEWYEDFGYHLEYPPLVEGGLI